MNNFRYRPKDNYIYEANWEQLYILTEHWKSNLLFYNVDLKFLHHLIDKYFLFISKKENIDNVQDIEISLLKLDNICDSLLESIDLHLHHIAELIDDPFLSDSPKFRKEHEQLEDNIAQFVKDFRKNRKDVFKISEHLIKSEELVSQLNVLSK
ncbi:hypothetical protein [Lacinutrix algicola]|uniref:hypothetical protein n=1 Tax=Lacinutrix algicola TaxID=342954 RepID=UPI0006E45991|nr:hypothetical protein [Lacinutrix algicola]